MVKIDSTKVKDFKLREHDTERVNEVNIGKVDTMIENEFKL